MKLRLPKVAAVIDEEHRREKDGKSKNRLLAVKLAARGEHSAAEIADMCGIARGHFFHWMKRVRKGGLEALRERGKPGPKEGTCRGLELKVGQELRAKLQAGDFVTAVEAQRWLKSEHGLEKSYHTVWRWLKKAGGVILVPRPSHSKKDPAAAEEFRQGLAGSLEALGLAPGSRVKVWMSDEARLGLHTEIRRLWACRGQRPVVSRQVKYEWDYLYGSLNVLNGEAHFCQIPSVSLEWDQIYLKDLAASDESVIHVVIRDQAGFHLRDGDRRLPERVRIIDLPPYNPELNPCEQLWDLIKDEIGNAVFATVGQLRAAMRPALQRYWLDPQAVLSLIGRDWLANQANAMPRK
ncbi:MAG: IS630 family transposase [Terrimicrobiaceae bacterium]